jgi:hypothetical protein
MYAYHFYFSTWVGSPLLRQPGSPLILGHHTDAELSVDTGSAECTAAQNSWTQAILLPQSPEELGLQACPTVPS